MADRDNRVMARVPTAERVRLDVIRTALTESPELHSYFTEPERGFSTAPRKGFFIEWNTRLGDPGYAETVLDELLKASLIRRRSGVIFEAVYRINKLDGPHGPIFVVTDFATNRARDRVFPWSDEAQSISRFLESRQLHHASKIVDVCSGAGTIALDIAARYRDAEVVGVDNNPVATELARFNAKLNGLANVQFRTGDLLAPFADTRWDYGIVNTPFSLEPPGVEEFDHSYGGHDGLLVVEKFLRSLREFPVIDRLYLLTYSPGTSKEPTSLDNLLERVGPTKYVYKRWHSLADQSRVWRVGEHKRFGAPMPLYYMMSRVFDASRLGATEKDIEREVDVHTAWHRQFYDAGLTHLHYGVVEMERKGP